MSHTRDEIAVVGIGLRFPGASTVAQFWQNLMAGADSIARFSRDELIASGVPVEWVDDARYVPARGVIEGAESFDGHFFNCSPREAELMDPQQRVFLEVAWTALEDAACDRMCEGANVGVFAGVGASSHLLELAEGRGFRVPGAEQILIGSDKDFLATRLAYKVNLVGPAVSVQTACSTSLTAVHLACQSLLIGECDAAVAGGVSIKVPQAIGYVHHEGGVHSPDGHCRPFDARSSGIVGGNGAGAVVLRRLDDAVRDGHRIYAVIKGSAVNNDGATKLSFTAPSIEGQTRVVIAAQELAGVEARSITYIEAHGTGTALGDPVEVRALTAAFASQTADRRFCCLGSVKGNIGHLDAASGVAGLIKTVLALHHRVLPPTAHFTVPHPDLALADTPFYVSADQAEWNPDRLPRRAGVTSLGVGGTNVHVVLEEAPELVETTEDKAEQILLVSARTPAALASLASRVVDHVRASSADLADIAHTLQLGRRHFEHREFAVCGERADAERLNPARADDGGMMADVTPTVTFLFPGGGTPFGEGLRLIGDRYGVVRETLAACGRSYRDLTAQSLAAALACSGEEFESLPLAASLPALFGAGLAMGRLLMHLGVQPGALLGHSLGEYTAACLAGVLEVEDAMRLVVRRGQLFDSLPLGAMLSVPLPEQELVPLLGEDLSLAAVNAPSICVASGPAAAIARLERDLTGRDVDCTRLPIRVAAHSAMLDPILPRYEEALRATRFRPPRIPVISSLTGRPLTREEATDPVHWTRQLRRCVRYADGVLTAMSASAPTFVEVGPGRTLSGFVRQSGAAQVVTCSAGRHRLDPGTDFGTLLNALGTLWRRGVDIQWSRLHEGQRRRRVSLPSYPFECTRYAPSSATGKGSRSVAAERTPSTWCQAATWRQVLPPRAASGGARVLLLAGAGPAAGVVESLWERGADVIVAERGEAFAERSDSFQIGRSPEDLLQLFRVLADRGIEVGCVAYCWNLGIPAEPSASGAGWEPALELLSLVRAVEAAGVNSPMRLVIVGAQMEDTNGGEAVAEARAALVPLARVITQEYPHIACRTVDIDTGPRAMDVRGNGAARLAAELLDEQGPSRVAWRGSRRLECVWRRFRLDDPAPVMRERGVYVITGGFGRIGWYLARHLAASSRARLLLTGRAADQALTPSAAARVAELEKLGGEAEYIQADVGDRDAMRAALARAEHRFGQIDGVIHAAGVLRHGLVGRALSETRSDDLAEQWRSKVDGVSVLSDLLSGMRVDFCIAFSSLAAVVGGIGHAAYAAANAAMEAGVSRAGRDREGPRWVSVGWDAWDFEGRTGRLPPALADYMMSPEDATRLFEAIVASRLTDRLVVSKAAVDERLRAAGDRPAAERGAQNTRMHPRPPLRVQYVAPAGPTAQRVAAVWEEALGVGGIGANDNFFELGGHSLLAARLVRRLREVLQTRLPLRVLFERPTIASLGEYLDGLKASAPGPDAAGIPTIRSQPGARHEPFPLTDVQEAYWIGRRADLELGNVATHSYLEIECDGIDVDRLQQAWQTVVHRHAMLRTVVDGDGTQRVLEQIGDTRIPCLDLQEAADGGDSAVAAVRAEMSHQVRAPDRWPLYDLRLTRRPRGRLTLHVSLDRLICDAWSSHLLARDLAAAYRGGPDVLPRLDVQFRDYVMLIKGLEGTPRWNDARDYWLARLDALPAAPRLPLAAEPASLGRVRFRRRVFSLNRAAWRRLVDTAGSHRVTDSSALLSAYVVTLARWAAHPAFTVNVTLFNRQPVDPQIDEIVGDFTSLNLLEAETRHAEPFSVLAGRVQQQLLNDIDHVLFSGVRVMRELRRRKGGGAAAMPVVFTSTLGLGSGKAGEPTLGRVSYSITQTPQVWIDNQVFSRDGELVMLWDAVDELFPPGMLDEMFAVYRKVVETLASDAEAWRRPAAELRADRRPPVAEQAPAVSGLRLEQLTAPHRQSSEPAVIAGAVSITHRDLDGIVERTTRALRAAGIGPGQVVGVYLEKGAEQVAAVLAVLRAGATYLPIDAGLPAERILRLLRRTGARVVLVHEPTVQRVIWPRNVLPIPVWLAGQAPEAIDAPGEPQEDRAIAYVMYTSGSTGEPKGVVIAHRGAVNTIEDINGQFGVTARDRVLALSSLGFDLSVYDIFGLLAVGGAVVMPGADEARDPAAWARLLATEGVTVWNSVPALMDLLLEYYDLREEPPPPTLRLVLLSGDWIPVKMPGRVRRYFPNARIVSLGGATEASIWSIYHEVTAVDPAWTSIPYGRALRHQSVTVLDADGQRCPTWVQGEIFIGGTGVAVGYWDDPARTALQFVPACDGSGRLYRTADLGRYLPSGEIEFLGRADAQVKIHGNRIELGEIESCLASHPGVTDAVVVAAGPAPHRRRLVAYVGMAPDSPRDAGSLKRQLESRLPSYMVPEEVHFVDHWPLTENGKIDRRALAARPPRPPEAVAAMGSPEHRRLAAIVGDVLERRDVGMEDSFFDLGGDSLSAVRLLLRLKQQFRTDLTLRDILETRTVGGLADRLRAV